MGRSLHSSQSKNNRAKVGPDELPSILLQLLDSNDKLVVVASAHSTHTLPLPQNHLAQLVKTLATHHPARFFGLGDSLEDLVTITTRLVSDGLMPIALLSAADLVQCYGCISALCLGRVPMVLLIDSEREAGQTLIANATNDLSVLSTLPTLTVGVPAGPRELKYLLQTACSNEGGPIALLYQHSKVVATKTPLRLNMRGDIGKAAMLREGKDLAILAVGQGVTAALETGQQLAQLGVEATVIDAIWVRPLDAPMLTAVAAHLPRLVTLEEGALNGGFGTAVLELLEQTNLFNVKVKRLSLSQTNLPTSEIVAFLKKIHETEGFNYNWSVFNKAFS